MITVACYAIGWAFVMALSFADLSETGKVVSFVSSNVWFAAGMVALKIRGHQ